MTVISFKENRNLKNQESEELETNFCKVKDSFGTPPTLCHCLIYTYKDFQG